MMDEIEQVKLHNQTWIVIIWKKWLYKFEPMLINFW